MNKHIPAVLVEETRQRNAVLFAGAGISFEALRLTRKDFQIAIGKRINKQYPTFEPEAWTLQEVYDAYEALTDRLTLCKHVADVVPKDANPTAAHFAAVSSFRHIITTNWDLLFEKAAEQMRLKFNVVCCDEDMKLFNPEGLNVIKIHGCSSRPHTIVASSEDHDTYRETHGRMQEAVSKLIGDHPVLYVGYSFRDGHVRRLLREIVRERGRDMRRGYAVVFPDEVMSAVFQRWSIELLAFEPDFLARLVEAAGIRAIVSKSDPLSLANVEFNVFLAYNSADLNMARKLYRTLKKRKLRPWFDQAELLPGDRWMRHIGAAISSVRCAAILFGTAGLGSWQRGEVDACIDACFARDLKVIPILLPGDPELSELPELIRGNQVSDLRAGFTAHVLDHLTYAIRSAVDKSPQY